VATIRVGDFCLRPSIPTPQSARPDWSRSAQG
jgi:hypothetical protein